MAGRTTLISASDNNFVSNAAAASSIASITQTPIPLTTIYTPPASCSDIITWDGVNLWQHGTNQTGGDCYPPRFKRIFNSYYTPGICPDAWTSAGELDHSIGFEAMCCPRGYVLSRSAGYACASLFSGVLRSVYFTSTAGNAPIASDATFTTVSRDGNQGVGTVIADVIQVQWQKKDTKVVSLWSEKAARTGAKTGARQTAPTPSSTGAIRNKGAKSGGMPTGAKVGIGIAVPIIVLSLLAIGAILGFRRRKQKAFREKEQDPHVESENFHELPPDSQVPPVPPDDRKWDQQKLDPSPSIPPQEMDAQQYMELPADGPVQELGGQQMQRGSTFKSGSLRSTQSPSTPKSPRKGFLR